MAERSRALRGFHCEEVRSKVPIVMVGTVSPRVLYEVFSLGD